MSKILKRDLQPPFCQQELMTTRQFIRYCADYGIKTDNKELEYFEGEQLLLPAVRVNPGLDKYRKIFLKSEDKLGCRYVRSGDEAKFDYKKIDPNIYYAPRTIEYGTYGWLDHYTENGQIIYPSESKFRSWKSYLRDRDEDFVTAKDQVEFTTFYSPYQVYIVNLIQKKRRLILANKTLYKTPEEWTALGKQINTAFILQRDNSIIKQRVLEINKFFSLFIQILEMWEERENKIKEELDMRRELNVEDKIYKVATSVRESIESEVDFDFKIKVPELLNKYGYDTRQIEQWRYSILRLGSMSSQTAPWVFDQYIGLLEEDTLVEKEDPYRWVSILNWCIYLSGGERKTVKELIKGSRYAKHRQCPICGSFYEPTKKTHTKTCGDKLCQRKYNSQYVSEKRQQGIY